MPLANVPCARSQRPNIVSQIPVSKEYVAKKRVQDTVVDLVRRDTEEMVSGANAWSPATIGHVLMEYNALTRRPDIAVIHVLPDTLETEPGTDAQKRGSVVKPDPASLECNAKTLQQATDVDHAPQATQAMEPAVVAEGLHAPTVLATQEYLAKMTAGVHTDVEHAQLDSQEMGLEMVADLSDVIAIHATLESSVPIQPVVSVVIRALVA